MSDIKVVLRGDIWRVVARNGDQLGMYLKEEEARQAKERADKATAELAAMRGAR